MLPHFRNITTANSLWEPVYRNLFEITIELPSLIVRSGETNSPIELLENAKSINIDVTKDIAEKVQRFKYSTRVYPGIIDDTTISFSINFNVNQTEDKNVAVWNHLRRWYDLAWNSQTGELHYKRDMIGQITTNVHDRTGEVIRRVTFENCQITSVTGWDGFSFGDDSIVEVTASFEADHWTDLYFDDTDQ